MITSVDDPCDLLRMASLLDGHLDVNAHYKRTLPAVVAAEAEYREAAGPFAPFPPEPASDDDW